MRRTTTTIHEVGPVYKSVLELGFDPVAPLPLPVPLSYLFIDGLLTYWLTSLVACSFYPDYHRGVQRFLAFGGGSFTTLISIIYLLHGGVWRRMYQASLLFYLSCSLWLFGVNSLEPFFVCFLSPCFSWSVGRYWQS